MVETNIDIADEFVRMTILESGTGRIVYSARYTPDIAREMAYNLTLKALELEDK
jgi:repressor of nif and glnA expression